MDAPGWIAVEEEGGKLAALWAVSERGTVYRMGRRPFSPLPGFPLVGPGGLGTSGRIAFPPRGSRLIRAFPLFVSGDGSTRFFHGLRRTFPTAPAASLHALAVLPRSFDSRLYLTDLQGGPLPGWPVALSGLASARPSSGGSDADSLRAVAITEAGELFAFSLDATPVPGFPVSLQGTFDAAPVWAPFARSI
jgi:hypothetical protein